jgi:hypothetical protein
MATSETTITLDNRDKWEDWELQFQAQVVYYYLIDQIFGDKPFRSKPIEPLITN